MRSVLGIGLMVSVWAGGCMSDRSPEPARVPGPQERQVSSDPQLSKPLPDGSQQLPPPPYNDAPLVNQATPETARFVDAYTKVGRPRIVVWVSGPLGGGYDEAAARSIDYSAVQTELSDWLSAGGRVAIISPEAARQALAPQETQALNSGQGVNGRRVSEQIHADVLVAVRAEVTHQSGSGPVVRVTADASNLAGGESIGRAFVDMPPPLDKPEIENLTRVLARHLMTEMADSWTSFGTNPPATEPH